MTAADVTRRQMLIAAAALPMLPRPLFAAAGMLGPATAPFHRFRLGGFEVTALLAGMRSVSNTHDTFGLNVSAEEFAAVSAANHIPADRRVNSYTPVVVNTGAELVLFDTGLAPAPTVAALQAAGYTPEQVDVVVLTHMHGDHIGGVMGEAGPTFANARYVTGAVEHNHWMGAGDETFDRAVRPLSERMTFLDDGGTAVAGITAIAAFGHSPGHMAWHVESAGSRLVIAADTANHYVWSLAHPDWEVRFDADKAAAAATRRRLLGMLAAERVPFMGYHMPFPALGFVETREDGFRYVPASYQFQIED